MWFLLIVEIILIAVILIIIAFLHLGVDLVGNFSKEGSELNFTFEVLVFSRIKIYGVEYPRAKDEKDKEKSKKKRKITLNMVEPCIGSLLEFLKKLILSLNVRKLESHLDFGLNSYVSTAKYVGYMWAFLVFPNTALNNTKLSVTPCFNGPVFDFKGIVDIRINLLKMIIPTLKLLRDKNVLKLIREAI
ncbi:MAG: DUF2953 domain-containing protein [Methanobrevibacter sp.]|uniref:DUF2953 domain-containing protein n=1 Tax=Methanobrevibacter sp. TaxID=66852 RepID=UPI0026E036A3|nr:DUF2953 domain-containing protein [Methanobrevibacter sp.]MDO5848501.1 DUF2953 domain-containing protein [Methanobrevibacter sp.]